MTPFIGLGFLLGSLLGARVAIQLPNLLLGRIFGASSRDFASSADLSTKAGTVA